MGVHLRIKNYRGIREVDFRAEGVCLLVGPNGSGKSTLLSSLDFLKNIFEHGFEKALSLSGGSYGFNHFDASPQDSASFEMETAGIRWKLSPTVHASGVVYPIPERVKDGDEKVNPSEQAQILEMLSDEFPDDYDRMQKTLFLRRLHDMPSDSADIDYKNIRKFVETLTGYQNFFNYRLWSLRTSGSQEGPDATLRESGQNAFSVLRNWLGSKPQRERYEFVRDVLREAFPKLFDDFDFEVAGRTVSMRIFPPDVNEHIPVYFAPNGFLAGMLHLMAACSAPDGGVIGIDEPENGLHPFAVKTILEALRDRARERKITILLATHSPFLLNEFKAEPHRIFVMDMNNEKQLTPLDELRDPEWLRFFTLGDLYGNDFAVQEKN